MSIRSIMTKYKDAPKSVKASLWFLVCSFLQKGITALSTPIFTRLLDTSEYGQYGQFNSWLTILTVFVTLDLSSGVFTQGLVKFSDERDQFASSIQGLSLCLVSAWTLIYLCFHDFWNGLFSLTTVQMIAMLVMMWATAAFHLWAAEQRVLLNYKTLVFVTIIASFLKPAVGILFVINANDKVTARILGLALVELVCYVGLFWVQTRKGKKLFIKKYWIYALGFNLPLVPHYLSQSVLSGADRIMIGRMIGNSEAGIYSLAYSIALIMMLFNNSLGHTISPWIYQKIKLREEKKIPRIIYLSLVIIAVVNIMLIAFAPELTRIFAPKKYYDAIYVIPPVAMSVYFIFCYDMFAKFEFYFEKTKLIAVATVMSALLNIVLNKIFIDIYGYVAAGYTTLACYILYAIFHYIMMEITCKKYMGVSNVFDNKILLLISTAFLVCGFVFMFLYPYALIRYIVLCTVIVVGIVFRKKLIAEFSVIKKRKQ